MADDSTDTTDAKTDEAKAEDTKTDQTTTDTAKSEKDEWDYDRGMATINKLRDELKAAKTDAKKASELEAKLKEYEDAQLSEKEKLEQRLAEREAKDLERDLEVQSLRLRLAVHSWKPREGSPGLADVDLALAALDRSKIEYDEAGSPKNLDDVIGDLLETKPILRAGGTQATTVAAGNTNAGGGTGSGTPPSLTAEELKAAADMGMTAERYALWKGKTNITEFQQTSETLEAANAQQ